MRSVASRSAVAIALAVGLAVAVPVVSQAIEVGDLAPDFTLPDVNGSMHQLSTLRGNVVLLAFIGYA